MKNVLHRWTLNFFLFILTGYFSYSQHIENYDSIYNPTPELSGSARFEYYEDGQGRKIKHGAFAFVREERPDSSRNAALYNSWEGSYKENLKDGPWTYKTRKHLVSITRISEVTLDYSINTIDELLQITYQDGQPVGKILLESTLYADEKPLKQLKYFRSYIQDGFMDGEFEFLLSD